MLIVLIVLIVFAHRADANVCSSCSSCLLIVLLQYVQLTYRAAYRVALRPLRLQDASGLTGGGHALNEAGWNWEWKDEQLGLRGDQRTKASRGGTLQTRLLL